MQYNHSWKKKTCNRAYQSWTGPPKTLDINVNEVVVVEEMTRKLKRRKSSG